MDISDAVAGMDTNLTSIIDHGTGNGGRSYRKQQFYRAAWRCGISPEMVIRFHSEPSHEDHSTRTPMNSSAFISDIHGNHEALTAVLEDIDHHGYEEIFCLGDVVVVQRGEDEFSRARREKAVHAEPSVSSRTKH